MLGESLATSIKRSDAPGGPRCLSEPGHALRVAWVGDRISPLVRKPNAGKLHVRFDERDLETEDMVSYSGTGIPKGPAHRLRLNLTPPRQISILPAAQAVFARRAQKRSTRTFSTHLALVDNVRLKRRACYCPDLRACAPIGFMPFNLYSG